MVISTNGTHGTSKATKPFPPGVHVPSLTWFLDDSNQEIDWHTQTKHISFLINSGLHGGKFVSHSQNIEKSLTATVVLAGTNGEAVTLSSTEKSKLVSTTRELATSLGRPDLAVILGCGGGSTRAVIEETKLGKESGADYALVMVPSYFHFAMNEEAIVAFFREVANASPIPVLIYNFPGVSAGLDVNSEMLHTLGAHPNIVGVKLTCGGIAKVARVRSVFEPENFCALAGQSDWLLPAISVGGTGAITGLANIYPRSCIDLYNLSIGDDRKAAEKAQIKLAAVEWGFANGGINGTKWVVAQYLGYPESSCHTRRPYPKFADVKRQEWILGIMKPLEAKEWGLVQSSSRQATSGMLQGHRADLYTSKGASATLSTSAAVPVLPNMIGPPNDNSFNDIFSYASFMWDPTIEDNMIQASGWQGDGFSDSDEQNIERSSLEEGNTFSASYSSERQHLPLEWSNSPRDHMAPSHVPKLNLDSRALISFNQASEKRLMEYFTRAVVPPIIAQVETELKWSSMRLLLISMAKDSSMVQYAILAFSELLMGREHSVVPQYQQYYQKAEAEVQRYVSEMSPGTNDVSAATLEYVLATLFFLSYMDLLEGGISNAHAHLKHAYDVFRKVDKSQFRMVGKRLVSWIRLLDARAVSAGGEGLFLLENNDDFIDQSSPTTSIEVAGGTDNCEADIEDVLFDALYQPGFLFFQKIQSFMGRISLIDPWHRSRGTVKDETEVMSIAAKIGRDLTSLWEQRPPLMDYALSGRLEPAHLSPSLAFTITRTFRTYYANYHASKIHLHRVAYKHLPLSTETEASVSNIRSTARVMVEGRLEEELLPVSMLWPLLMWGSEENDAEIQGWILDQINRLEKVATNAEITGQVLREVQMRQKALKQRVDIRTVMHDIFNSCFAIV
ncbi:hypothetical protein VTL71DRAFT_7064 [Oculimacula yallundae]|uniref:Uncharacterized protein n=1 Tax=Oculimacula yallundae TaxID=86028 RepID=A0ABR4BVL5_9HELO